MFNIRDSNVFIEIGDAIGNVGKKMARRMKSNGEMVDQAFRRLLRQQSPLQIPLERPGQAKPSDDVIEAVFKVLEDKTDGGDV